MWRHIPFQLRRAARFTKQKRGVSILSMKGHELDALQIEENLCQSKRHVFALWNELLGAVETGCDVTFRWMILIRNFEESSAPAAPLRYNAPDMTPPTTRPKQRDTSFELSPILWTVDLSKHLITAWIFQNFIQLDNFATFSVFFFFFGNRVRLNLHERAPSCFRGMRDFCNCGNFCL